MVMSHSTSNAVAIMDEFSAFMSSSECDHTNLCRSVALLERFTVLMPLSDHERVRKDDLILEAQLRLELMDAGSEDSLAEKGTDLISRNLRELLNALKLYKPKATDSEIVLWATTGK